MITSITLPSQPPFDGTATSLDALKHVTYVFGANGTGKTTISRLIATETQTKSTTHVTWENDQPLDTYVYNRDFIDTHFADSSSVPGVFTLGQESIETERRIKDLSGQIVQLDSEIGSATNQRDAALEERLNLDDKLTEIIWREHKKYGPVFKRAWQGVGRSKRSLRQRFDQVISLQSDNKIVETISIIELEASKVFDKSQQMITPIIHPNFEGLIAAESQSLLRIPIVGKEDLPIGALIQRLDNAHWVQAGLPYAEAADDTCPFCQQPLPAHFFEEIEAFFDEDYREKMRDIRNLRDAYASESNRIALELGRIRDDYETLVEYDRFGTLIESFLRITEANCHHLEEKVLMPSQVVELESLGPIKEQIDRLIDAANQQIAVDNKLISERHSRIEPLVGRVWRHLVHTVRSEHQTLFNRLDAVNKRIDGLNTTISTKESTRDECMAERTRLTATLTNVTTTAQGINDILHRFGFTGFRVDVTEDQRHYRIVRGDGTPVEQTLSEGERHFLTFLYFHRLASGAFDERRASERRVLVIDDPITSMIPLGTRAS